MINECELMLQVPELFNRVLQSNTMQLTSISETSSKDVSQELKKI